MSQHANIQPCDVGHYGHCLITHTTIAGSSDVWLALGPMRTSIDPDAARRLAAHLIEAADAADRADAQQARRLVDDVISTARRSA